MAAYYNEHDPKAAAWLRELINADLIAPGDVDERDVWDVTPADVMGYRQCHFFAGIGVWSHALRQAGWPDERPVWTGSAPCQPFSAAGKGGGFDDERHLWPAWFWLIRQCRPRVVFGEQVASKAGLAWLDLVQADLEGEGYACGALDLCAAGVGAPHIRQRLYFVADAKRSRERGWSVQGLREGDSALSEPEAEQRSVRGSPPHLLADAERRAAKPDGHNLGAEAGGVQGEAREQRLRADAGNGEPVNGFWRNAVWVPCRDGKARPTEPGTQPLAHGVAERVGLLRGYGNAIVAPLAAEFVRAFMDTGGVR